MLHDKVSGAVYSPDGKRILSWPAWSDDEPLRLWDAATGAAIGEPLRHEGPVKGALYSADGRRFLSWSEDKTLRLWDVSWRGEIACDTTPMMSSKEEMERLSKRYGIKIDEPICQPGVKIPDPDWSRMEPAHADKRVEPIPVVPGEKLTQPTDRTVHRKAADGSLVRALSRCRRKSAMGLQLLRFQAAVTALRHVLIAAARKVRCVEAEVRWRWTLKVLKTAA